eukprot:GEMP01042940.1.p1 GENE.GEMP01042940.1~~GEMP01042940.1.p1  ORF type:complete len:127 (-),score=26.40 GEMP01042940.1:123-503(-)
MFVGLLANHQRRNGAPLAASDSPRKFRLVFRGDGATFLVEGAETREVADGVRECPVELKSGETQTSVVIIGQNATASPSEITVRVQEKAEEAVHIILRLPSPSSFDDIIQNMEQRAQRCENATSKT